MFPPEFEKSVNAELPGEAAALLAALDGEAVTSVRFNPFKLEAMPAEEGVPWNRYGAYLAQRPVFTLDPAMHAGAYYVQEPSSQFVEYLYRKAAERTGVVESDTEVRGMRVLDLCAAPGGKTTLYSTLAGAEGLVVANEVIKQRASVLADNVRRWGIGNVAVSCNDAAAFAAYRHWFDVLAVDAPCSGEGMFRKNPQARAEWSLANVELCAARQRRILAEGWDALRPGGILIYSTCTFNRHENEENIIWLAENYAVEPIGIELPDGWGIEQGKVAGGIETFRFYPHKVRGEGFFVAVMHKTDGRIKRETPRARREPLMELNRNENRPLTEWIAQPEHMKFARVGDNCYAFYRPQYQNIAALAGGLNIIYSGVCMGCLFNGKLRPDHALALFHDLAHESASGGIMMRKEAADDSRARKNFTRTPLSRDEALDYLRKREFADVSTLAEGLNLLTFEDLPIGWTKRIGHRTNTMLPNNFRIVNL
jgi:16S rRNA C967 or C1407 C5-methylase (RsmB/RsmF family)